MRLYKAKQGIYIEHDSAFYRYQDSDWDQCINRTGLHQFLLTFLRQQSPTEIEVSDLELLAPLNKQEIWAAGVTYFRSRVARMEESATSGGANFYDKVYEADRPELFFKATALRCSGPNEQLYIRKDSRWDVPEPELTLFINSQGNIEAYTIGNDMSSRSIEGENPLYLPQAKVYDRCAGLGPCLYIPDNGFPRDTIISMQIKRAEATVFDKSIGIDQMKRSFEELVQYLYRECHFPHGCFLMTGTGIVPDNDFTLSEGDEISISIPLIGTLSNTVGRNTTGV